jgi:hypothetical protein
VEPRKEGKMKEDEMSGTHNMCGGDENAYRILVRNLKGRDHSEYLGIDGKIILEWILGKKGGKVWTG